MKTVGLITEYNPFHNGHLYHLRESKRAADAEVAVAVMSGHFLQRGEPALADKWVRAEMALRAGVDVVFELPFPFACNSAPHFARGAVDVLEALGTVDALCFGSEAGEIDPLRHCADLLVEREGTVDVKTAALLREGVNYPAARAQVLAELDGSMAGEQLASPNNILGIEYLKALRQTGSVMRPLTIRRIGAGYHDASARGAIASATGIRRMLAAGEDIAQFIPAPAREVFFQAVAEGRLLDPEKLFPLLAAALLRSPDALKDLYLVGDGLERRLAEAARSVCSHETLVEAVKSRHFTRTRIQRILCYVLTGALREEMESFLESGPLYLRLLAASEKGRAFLAAARKTRSLPVLDNLSRVHSVLKRHYGDGRPRHQLAEKMLDLDLRATALYTLLMKNWPGGDRNRDFFTDVISPR
jgi:predicted nucleotidyltransferase